MVLKANINALNLMRAAIGSQCKLINRGVMCVLFDSLKINLAATIWINCRGLIKTCQESISILQSEQNKSLIKELCCML